MRRKENFWFTDSFLNGHCDLGWAGAKQEPRGVYRSPRGSQSQRTWAIFCCFLTSLAKSCWMGTETSGTGTGARMGWPCQWLYNLYNYAPLAILFFILFKLWDSYHLMSMRWYVFIALLQNSLLVITSCVFYLIYCKFWFFFLLNSYLSYLSLIFAF